MVYIHILFFNSWSIQNYIPKLNDLSVLVGGISTILLYLYY